MGWPSCLAALCRTFSNRGTFPLLEPQNFENWLTFFENSAHGMREGVLTTEDIGYCDYLGTIAFSRAEEVLH